MIIRPATGADAPRLPQIEVSAGAAFRGTDQAWIADDTVTPAEAYSSRIAAGLVLVAEIAGVVRAFAASDRDGDDLHLLELSTESGWQGRGLGAGLVLATLELGRALGVGRVVLTTFRAIPWNAPFYSRLGFEILETPEAHLAEVLAAEAERGMTDRCAMACLIQDQGRA